MLKVGRTRQVAVSATAWETYWIMELGFCSDSGLDGDGVCSFGSGVSHMHAGVGFDGVDPLPLIICFAKI